MPCTVAKHAGFCMGVRQAVEKAERAAAQAQERGIPCYSLGEVVHNPLVTSRLQQLGVQVVERVEDARGGLLILRSHGVAPQVLSACRENGVDYVDCTCARVRALHERAAAYSARGAARGAGGRRRASRGARHSGMVPGASIHRVYRRGCGRPAPFAPRIGGQPDHPAHGALASAAASPAGKNFPAGFYCSICAATRVRQQAARELAIACDRMIVVGGRQSANTRKLYEACLALCPQTIWVERAADIPPRFADIHAHHIGIAAGASTPDWSFKEVVTAMNDIENKVLETEPAANEAAKTIDENDFMASIEASMRRIHTGQTVTGTVVQVTDDEVCVNIGYKSDGLIKRSDLVDQDVKIGDEIEVEVVKVNDGEGNVILSQRNIINKKAWDALMAKYEAGEYVEGVGKEAVKGGLICMVDGVRAFVPASRLSKRYVEKIDQFVGQTMKLKIIDVDAAKKRHRLLPQGRHP